MVETKRSASRGAGALLGASLWLALSGPVAAQAAPREQGGWQFEITPYLWAAGLNGNTRIANTPQANIDMSPSDVLKNLDFGLMGAFEARHGRWGVFSDYIYAKLSDAASGNVALRRGPGIDVNVNAKLRQTIFALAGEYRIVEGRVPVDVLAGARYNKIDLDANVALNFFGPLGISANPIYQKAWWDPYVGVRAVVPVAERWSLTGYADAGGSRSWQLLGGASYAYSEMTSFKFGYRFYHVNYDHGGFKYDMDQKGFYGAAGFKF